MHVIGWVVETSARSCHHIGRDTSLRSSGSRRCPQTQNTTTKASTPITSGPLTPYQLPVTPVTCQFHSPEFV